MLFNSFNFLIFLAVVNVLYLFCSHRLQNLVLLVASFIFYGGFDIRFLLLLAVSIIVDYFAGLRIQNSPSPRSRKFYLGLSLSVNLGLLGFFKYFNFFNDSILRILAQFKIYPEGFYTEVLLPIGISFYTFQTLSYTIDIYRGKIKPTNNFIDFALYVSFFPQLIAGPIERASRFLPQIIKPRTITEPQLKEGVYLIAFGFFKKMVLADNLKPFSDQVLNSPANFSAPTLLLGMYALMFKVYCDYSGYIDIARGIGKIMGFDLAVNFRQPFFATNPSDLFNRWNITLTSWFRDYVYIPLGGNKGSKGKIVFNLMITLLLAGLWHGAAVNFLYLGLSQGVIYILYYIVAPKFSSVKTVNTIPSIYLRLVSIFIFFHISIISWSFFAIQSHHHIYEFFSRLLTWTSGASAQFHIPIFEFLCLFAILICIDIFSELDKLKLNFKFWLSPVLLFLTLLYGVVESYEFVYFQF